MIKRCDSGDFEAHGLCDYCTGGASQDPERPNSASVVTSRPRICVTVAHQEISMVKRYARGGIEATKLHGGCRPRLRMSKRCERGDIEATNLR